MTDSLTERRLRPRRDHPASSGTRRVLVVEGDLLEQARLTERLARHGYATVAVGTGTAAIDCHRAADLILLDLDLPDLDGLEVCRIIRKSCAVPIIILTARTSELDCVVGLRSGADNYVVKPYAFRELTARMEAVLRRFHPRGRHDRATTETIRHGSLLIHIDTRQVSMNGRRIDTTRKEFDLLLMLASTPRQVITRTAIMEQIWDASWPSRTLDTHINTLRRKLGGGEWIATVRGIGFRFVGDESEYVGAT